MAVKQRVKYRLVKILCIGIIIGALFGMLIMAMKANATVKKSEQAAEAVEKKLKKENESLKQELEELQSGDAATEIAKKNAEQLASDADDWSLVLVNSSNPLDTSYAPELTAIGEDRYVDSRIADVTNEMLQDAKADGMNFYIVSAYRDYNYQREVFSQTMSSWIGQGKTPLEAYEETAKSVAIPGTSEHSTGLALDITSGEYGELDEQQANTQESKWLEKNCYKYGYILRYPSDKSDATGIVYEPWHYRYVGKEAAKEITEKGITLEEYLNNL